MEKRPCGIYVHIPFCKQKCKYCDFLSAPGNSDCIREYVSALKKEIEGYAETAKDYRVLTLYIGGGTPSVLEAEQIADIVGTLRSVFDMTGLEEFTIEVNPGTVTPEKLKGYREAGANRLSVGIQSANDEELRLLGRIHNFEEACICVEEAREAGFENLSVDVISALPYQTIGEYSKTLDKIIALKPEHISSYSLIVEPGTPFFEDYGENGAKRDALPDEETDRRMYALTKEKLAAAGYERYEISNYAIPGFESKHNSSYWTGREYFGLGLGASSFVKNVRYSNLRDMAGYKKDPSVRVTEEITDEAGLMAEFMILGLRMTAGVSKKEFKRRFGREISDVYAREIEKFKGEKVMEEDGDMLRLTDYGLDVSNMVFAEFL